MLRILAPGDVFCLVTLLARPMPYIASVDAKASASTNRNTIVRPCARIIS
jgi:hypothetical protein